MLLAYMIMRFLLSLVAVLVRGEVSNGSLLCPGLVDEVLPGGEFAAPEQAAGQDREEDLDLA
jgi:hypothetical protein